MVSVFIFLHTVGQSGNEMVCMQKASPHQHICQKIVLCGLKLKLCPSKQFNFHLSTCIMETGSDRMDTIIWLTQGPYAFSKFDKP